MKDYLQKIKSIVGGLKKEKTSYERGGINPGRDWRILLSITFVILCILAILAVYFYIQIDRGRLFVVPEDSIEDKTKINMILLEKIVGEVKAREARSADIKEGRMAVPSDPSM